MTEGTVLKGMDSVLDVLHRCAAEYKANETKRIAELKEGTKRRTLVSKPKKKRSHKKESAPKKNVEKKSIEELVRKKPVDKCIERAKEYIDGTKGLYGCSEPIPHDERAECFTPWCMHNVNGRCVHRECIVYLSKQKMI